jgi:hypothetical protein
MKQLETFVLTADEAVLRGLHPTSPDATNFAACAAGGGKILLYKFFNDYMSAALWTLEKSVWEYTP